MIIGTLNSYVKTVNCHLFLYFRHVFCRDFLLSLAGNDVMSLSVTVISNNQES